MVWVSGNLDNFGMSSGGIWGGLGRPAAAAGSNIEEILDARRVLCVLFEGRLKFIGNSGFHSNVHLHKPFHCGKKAAARRVGGIGAAPPPGQEIRFCFFF